MHNDHRNPLRISGLLEIELMPASAQISAVVVLWKPLRAKQVTAALRIWRFFAAYFSGSTFRMIVLQAVIN